MNTKNYSYVNKWCLGVPCVGTRQLSSAEISYLKQRLNIIRLIWIGFMFSSIALPPFVFLLFHLTSNSVSDFIGHIYAVLSLISLLIGFPVLFSLANDYFKKAGHLKKDISLGFICQFEGISKEVNTFFEKPELPEREKGEKQIFEVLPITEAIFSYNGNISKKWYEAEITEAISSPENPFIVSLPRDVLQVDFSKDEELTRRRLIAAEIDELKSHIKQLRKVPKLTFVAPLIVALVLVFGDFWNWFEEYKIQFLIALSFSLLSVYVFLKNLICAWKFSKDLKLGWVIISKKQEAEEYNEILPSSFAFWTEKGKPSNWRMRKNRK